MGEEKWIKRKPGNISGTVLPPPAEQDKSQPQRTVRRRGGHADAGSGNGAAEPTAPAMPDSLRTLFKPVLSTAEQTQGTGVDRAKTEVPDPVLAGTGTPGAQSRAAEIRDNEIRDDEARDPQVRDPQVRDNEIRDPEVREPAQQAWGGQGGQRAPWPAARRRVAWMVMLTVLALMAGTGTTIVLLSQSASGQQTKPGGSDHTVLAGVSSAMAVRMATARWVVREISPSAIIGCDTVMCAALEKAGRSPSDLQVIKPAAPDPLGVDVLVATPVLRSQFGGRLATEYAPSILAKFGRGQARVDVRVVAADGAAAFELALGRDIAARKRFGGELTGNSRIAMSGRARSELAGGQVDPRVLLALPALATQHPIRIIAFTDRAPRAGPGVPLTVVRLAGADSQAGLSQAAYQRWLLAFLHQQRAQFRPLSVTITHARGYPVVVIRYSRPTPLGLLRP